MTYQFDELQLMRLLQEAAEAGARRAIENLMPSDKMSLREVYRWFKLHGHKQNLADRLIEEGIIRGNRIGTGKNSKIVYSEADICLALKSKQAERFLTI